MDWISFKFQHLDVFTKEDITDYLFKLGFNSYQESGKLAKPVKEPVRVSCSNKLEVLFVKESPYWRGTTLNFSGSNASAFYTFVQKNLIDWTVLYSGILSRFDLHYSRNNKIADKISGRDFLNNCLRELKQTNKNVSLEKNTKGLVLKIGNRRSNNYSRIYEEKNSLRFEHEMKGRFLQKYHLLLVENRLEELEQKLSSHYLTYFGKLLLLEYCFTDWLVIKLRPSNKQRDLQCGFNSDYIKSEILMDTKSFVMLIQFLNYAQHLDFEIEYLGGVAYRQVTFKVRDF